jgi:hypothetical protein
MNTSPAPALLVGHITNPDTTHISVVADSPAMLPHIGKPWLNDYIAHHKDIFLERRTASAKVGDEFCIDPAILGRNSVICGKAGSGKTRLAMHLYREQLRLGCSAVVMDVQDLSIRTAIHIALECGIPPSRITVLNPRLDYGIPGWNPFDFPLAEIEQASTTFVELVKDSAESGWGSRMDDILRSATNIVASQGLSVFELMQFLRDTPYRDALVAKAAASPEVYDEFLIDFDFFQNEFSKLKPADQAKQISPILNKIRKLVRNKFFRSLTCAKTDTMDLRSLWEEQRVIVVLLDKDKLGTDLASILSGMMTHSLRSTAMQHLGKKPVLLFLDEMGLQSKFGSGGIIEIVSGTRQRNLRVMAACQSLTQLHPTLQTALLTSTDFKAFLTLGVEDAPNVSRILTAGIGGSISKISVGAEREETVQKAFWIRREDGKRLQFNTDTGWQGFLAVPDKLAYLQDKAENMGAVLYAEAAGRTVPLGEFVEGVPPSAFTFGRMRPKDAKANSAAEAVYVSVTFPKPKVQTVSSKSQSDRTSELQNSLQNLQPGYASVWAGGKSVQIQVVDVPFPHNDDLPKIEDYLGNGRSKEEMRDIWTWRLQRMNELRGVATPEAPSPSPTVEKRTPPSKPEVMDDGSL